ncbi:nicotinamide-nucleotide amidase [Stackebrandtia endophytica]|uniref:Nicotinamide-nucleotide amidase n=1 Tax=Stackebrandtia endophytica TaxID=1496996 RepID=A0A543B295_9ACTN|nr:nicotinamide-nucleotide amidohydrolase family protein [Stackebrandtia endophytica]TQL78926.1 nicotinamide-nucleotide amidase [Stackebrandtia endophytica]
MTQKSETTPAQHVIDRLTERGETVAVAESLTGGLVSAALVVVAGASAVFRAGVVAYTPQMKTELIDVPAETIQTYGVVSAEVARAMAAGVRRRCGTDWGIGTTGAAGPEPHGGQSPGVVWLSVCGPGDSEDTRRYRFSGDRQHVRSASVERVLLLLDGLSREPGTSDAD